MTYVFPNGVCLDYACFQHNPNKRFPLEAARDEIIAVTEQICGKGKNISQQEIRVSLHSSKGICIKLGSHILI